MKIFLSLKIDSLNKQLRKHWAIRSREGKNWQQHIWASLNGKILKPSGKRFVRICSYRKRLLDQDNFVGGAKMVVDAMKKLGIIKDDTIEFVHVEYIQVKSHSEYTEISWNNEF